MPASRPAQPTMMCRMYVSPFLIAMTRHSVSPYVSEAECQASGVPGAECAQRNDPAPAATYNKARFLVFASSPRQAAPSSPGRPPPARTSPQRTSVTCSCAVVADRGRRDWISRGCSGRWLACAAAPRRTSSYALPPFPSEFSTWESRTRGLSCQCRHAPLPARYMF